MTLRTLLYDFQRKYPQEKENINKSIGLLNKFNDNTAFFRNCFDDGHFTGSVLVINKEKTKVLLMHHIKFDKWQQFGGHADGDMDIRNVAIRELEEEAGIDERNIDMGHEILNLDIQFIPARKDEPDHYHYDVAFLAIVDSKIIFKKQDSEVHDIKWFDIARVLNTLDTGKYSSGLSNMIKNI